MRQLLVFGINTFRLTIPNDARITFGPWSPPTKHNNDRYDNESKKGTLRIYQGTEKTGNVLAVFAGVNGFRDLTLGYAELVTKEEGASVWKDDKTGYYREDKVDRKNQWVDEEPFAIEAVATNGTAAKKKRRR